MRPRYVEERNAAPDEDDANEQMHQHSLNRVKKNINDFIMRDFRHLFALSSDSADTIISRSSFLACDRLL